MIGSLTFLPAVLSYLGQKNWLEKGRVPYLAKRRHNNGGESRVWNAILDRVIKHPVVSVVLAGGLLVALTIPALGMQFKEAGTEGLSRSEPIIQTLDRIDAAFPGGSVPASVVDQGQGRHHARGQGRDRAAARQGDRERPAVRAVQRRGQPREDRRGRVDRRRRQGHRRRVGSLAGDPA